jgi:hypothetical protein
MKENKMSVKHLTTIVVLSPRSEYQAALIEFQRLASKEKNPKRASSFHAMEAARKRLAHLAERADLKEKSMADVNRVLRGSAWCDVNGQVRARLDDLTVSMIAEVREVDGRLGMIFQYWYDDEYVDWVVGWVRPRGEEWEVITDGTSWLHANRDYHGLADEQIDKLHSNVVGFWKTSRLRFCDGREEPGDLS